MTEPFGYISLWIRFISLSLFRTYRSSKPPKSPRSNPSSPGLTQLVGPYPPESSVIYD
ncbi:hypothetical protein Hanom_Chr09g00792711 [Helianthus anomalus]